MRIEGDPVDDVPVVGRSALGLPLLLDAERAAIMSPATSVLGEENPVLQAVAQGVVAFVELDGDERLSRRHARRHGAHRGHAEGVGHENPLPGLDRFSRSADRRAAVG